MIYVCGCEKNTNIPIEKGMRYVIVGNKTKRDVNKYLYDDVGDNIAELNPEFCELTAMYSIWKNCNDDYKGLCHYRRKFFKSYGLFMKQMSEKQVLSKLQNSDIVVPNKPCFKETLYDMYAQDHYIEDLDFCLNYINEHFDGYKDAVSDFKKTKSGYFWNIFYTKKEIFNDYCEWLFEILFALLKSKNNVPYEDPYQRRVYGFLSERLFNIYIAANKLKATEVEVRLSTKKIVFIPYFLIKLKRKISSTK